MEDQQKQEISNFKFQKGRELLFSLFFAAFFVICNLSFAPAAQASGLIKPANNLGLVGYWSFEDATGTKATDFSGKGNTGTITQASGYPIWSAGKFGQAIDFNNNTGNVDTGSAAAIDDIELQGGGGMSISYWVKLNSLSGTQYLIRKTDAPSTGANSSNGGWTINNDSDSGRVEFMKSYDSTLLRKRSSNACRSGSWCHVVVLWNGSGSSASTDVIMYINGSQAGHAFGQNSSGNKVPDASNNIYIGGSNSALNGAIDDVRIYNRVLGATEISALYAAGGTKVNSSRSSIRGPANGLVGYWTFDGPDVVSTTLYDRSGQTNNGTSAGGPLPTSGKLGQAFKFDGVDDRISAGNASSIQLVSGDYTLAAWVKPVSVSGRQWIIAKTANSSAKAYSLLVNNGEVSVDGEEGGNDGVVSTTNASLTPGNWYHLAATMTSSTLAVKIYVDGVEKTTTGSIPARPTETVSDLEIGWSQYINEYFNGLIDDVRIYNRALSVSEIQQLYNLGTKISKPMLGAPGMSNLLLWHTFDGPHISGTTSVDASDLGKNGILTNGPIPASGKLGQALSFDGNDDFVVIANPTSTIGSNQFSQFTFSAWIRPNSLADGMRIFGTSDGNRAPWIHTEDPSSDETKVHMYLATDAGQTDCAVGSATNAVTAGSWTHVVAVWDGSVCQIYIDGFASGSSDTTSGTLMVDPPAWRIGGNPGLSGRTNMNGRIDDVRVYNKALTAAEILQLYNLGR